MLLITNLIMYLGSFYIARKCLYSSTVYYKRTRRLTFLFSLVGHVMTSNNLSHMRLYLFIPLLICIFLCPYSFWLNIWTVLLNNLQTSSFETAFKSSTLYIITQKYIFHDKQYEKPAFNDKTGILSRIDASELEFLRSLVRSQQSRIGQPSKANSPGCEKKNDLKQEAHMSMLLAVKHQATGHHDMALKLLKHAAALDPENSIILNLLGEAFEKIWSSSNHSHSLTVKHTDQVFTSTEHIVSAEECYTRALINDPDNAKAKSNRHRTSRIVKQIDQQR